MHQSDVEQGEHAIHMVFDVTTQDNTDGEVTKKPFNTGAWAIEGGNTKLEKPFKNKKQWVINLLTEDYNQNIVGYTDNEVIH